MADKKRKTLQIKRPSATGSASGKKPISINKKSDEGSPAKKDDSQQEPQVGNPKVQSKKSSTSRISLPDGDKIRKARGEDASSGLKEDEMPSAEQLEKIGNNQTMPIQIDDKKVEPSSPQKLPEDTSSAEDNDQTMQIDVDNFISADAGQKLEDAAKEGSASDNDQTMQIDVDAMVPSDAGQKLEDAAKEGSASDNDQTMQIDTDDLVDANDEEKLEEANKGASAGNNDQTLQIDEEEVSKSMSADQEEADVQDNETMSLDDDDIDSELTRQEMEESFNAQTMAMDPDQLAKELSEPSQEKGASDSEAPETELTREEMEESFNAQTMAMDPDQLAKELENASEKDEPLEANMTMDLTQKSTPKTVMVKRPSRQDTASNAPTVKASRPVVANRGTAKESTSRIDIPSSEENSKQSKTIKLKRPAGGSKPSSITSGSGIELDGEPSMTPFTKKEKKMGGPWVAVAVITLLVSLAAIWSILAISQPELPMPGRIVDANGQIIR